MGNLAFIGFGQIPGGTILFWTYQVLAVALLAAASMTAFQDLQATAWRDVAIGEIPEIVVYRNPAGTFTRSVTAGFIIAIIIMFLVRGKTSLAVPYYGIGVFMPIMPIMVMSLSIRKHFQVEYSGRRQKWGVRFATFSAILAATIFIGQIVGKWEEGGWVVLISFSLLIILAHGVLISRAGQRGPDQIHRIVREKARVQGRMASLVEWQSLRMQAYRYQLLQIVGHLFDLFGIRRPGRFEPVPVPAGDYDHALNMGQTGAPSLLAPYLTPKEPTLGGAPKETEPGEE